jgi:hypothetical protein
MVDGQGHKRRESPLMSEFGVGAADASRSKVGTAQDCADQAMRLALGFRWAEAEVALRQALALAPTRDVAEIRQTLRLQLAALDGLSMDDEDDRAMRELHAEQTYLADYDGFVEGLRQTRYVDFPKQIHIETLTQCNASCNFCPYPGLDRKKNRMPDEVLYKILADLRDIPADLPFELCPFNVNEPFLDVRIFDVLAYCNKHLANASLVITTNGSPLAEKVLDRLQAVQNIGVLYVSFADHRQAEYEAAMQIPYAKTLERLDALHAAIAKGTLSFPVCVTRVGNGTTADADFVAWMNNRYPAFRAQVFRRQNWLGQVSQMAQDAVPHVSCHRWFEMHIISSGVVAHCCMDGRAEWPMGDVSGKHLLDVYNAPHFRDMRLKAISRQSLAPCNTCSLTAR